MRSYDPTDEYEVEELAHLAPEPWMVELLALNPPYVSWGPHEDHMCNTGDGWDSRKIIDSWQEFGPWGLDEYNECVNFYFEIGRDSKPCETCGGKCRHPHAQWITESWYRHTSPFTTPDPDEIRSKQLLQRFGCQFTDSVLGRGTLPPDDVVALYGNPFLEHCVSTMDNGGEWATNLTQDETDALWDQHRLRLEFKNKPTAEEVNAWAKSRRGIGHDAINSWICSRRRCERLGVPYDCPSCKGHGSHFIAPAHINLVLWILHPRKGCSRGVEVRITQQDLPMVFDWLQEAAKRNASRFAKAVKAARRAKASATQEAQA